jgi:hypothetical protein
MPAPEPDDQRHELEGAVIRVLQVLGYGDVIPNDYFVLEPVEGEPVAVPGPLFSAAVEALARAAKPQP